MTAHAADVPRSDTGSGWAIASLVCVVLSIALQIAGLFVLPALLSPAGGVLALASVPMSARWRTFQAAAVALAAIGFVADMTVAVLAGHKLY